MSFPPLDNKRDFLEMNVTVVQFLENKSFYPPKGYSPEKGRQKY